MIWTIIGILLILWLLGLIFKSGRDGRDPDPGDDPAEVRGRPWVEPGNGSRGLSVPCRRSDQGGPCQLAWDCRTQSFGAGQVDQAGSRLNRFRTKKERG